MIGSRSRWRRKNQDSSRGGVLFELLLAIAIFAGAAAFSLASVKSVFAALDRSRREQMLMDAARTRMAQLETGMISLADLRESVDAAPVNDGQSANQQLNAREGPPAVKFQVATSATELAGLTLVELTASEPAETGGNEGLSFTLRQLVPLREPR